MSKVNSVVYMSGETVSLKPTENEYEYARLAHRDNPETLVEIRQYGQTIWAAQNCGGDCPVCR